MATDDRERIASTVQVLAMRPNGGADAPPSPVYVANVRADRTLHLES